MLWIVCSLVTLASCSKDDEMPADDAIRFDNRIGEPYVDGVTRGTVTDNSNFNEFGVFAYYAASGLYNTSSNPNYMYNVKVTRKNGVPWTYTPVKFWPQGSVSFFAYSPYSGANNIVSVGCTVGAPVVTYAVPNNVADHRDLLLSALAPNKTQTNNPVLLNFRHALACINFKARITGTLNIGESIKVTNISLGNFKHKASCHHELADAITQTFTTDATDNAYSLSVTNNALLNNLLLTQTDQQITSANGCPMLWPQSIDNTDKLTVTAEYISNGMARTIVFECNMQSVVATMAAGKRYTFTLLFNTFGSMNLTCTVVDWDAKIINVPDFD